MAETTENFENKRFNPFLNQGKILLDNNSDPDENFFDETSFSKIDAQYFSLAELKENHNALDNRSFSILHVNIRSLNKNFGNFKSMLSDLSYDFSVICVSETWCSNDSFQNNSDYNLSQYNSVHQERKGKRGGGVCVYINKKYNFKYRTDFSASDENHETLSIEIMHKNSKNIIVNTCYRPPNANIKPLKAHITKILNSLCKKNQKIFFVGDFNINSLDYANNSKVKGFIDGMFSKGLISVINKPTRVSKHSMTCIDHIYTNSFINQDLTTGIIKTDISDHFPVFVIDNNMSSTNYPDMIVKKIRSFNEKNVHDFKNNLNMTDWSLVLETEDPNQSYSVFLKQFLKIYNKSFPTKSITIKRKQMLSPWITKGLKKNLQNKNKSYTLNF